MASTQISQIKKASNSLLLITRTLNELKRNKNLIAYLIEESFKLTNKNLFIYCTNNKLNDRIQLRHIIKQFYTSSFKINPHVNVNCVLPSFNYKQQIKCLESQLLDYDLILTDDHNRVNQFDQPTLLKVFMNENLPHFKFSQSDTVPLYEIDCSSIKDIQDSSSNGEEQTNDNENNFDLIARNKTYDNTILGGTFDRLHIGHKIMLTDTALLTNKRVLVGMADEKLLLNKKLAELIEPIEVRCQAVKNFFFTISPYLEVLTPPINDPFGPSIIEPDYQCIVVSQETAKGGELVNLERTKNGLPLLDVHITGLVNESFDLEENKINEDELKYSSSNERKRLLGTLLRPPYIPYDSSKPYLIGLTGGLASGKSNIRKDLEELGAATIDCDKLGHMAYEKNTKCYEQVVEAFGRDILDSNENIDRKLLGKKVFGKREELLKLNAMVWPEIKRLVLEEVDKQFKIINRKIIVIEAAVLFEANWNTIMNEIWVSFVPDAEAIKRSIQRDESSEEKAKNILKSQMSNKERIQKANVVFCSLWQREYTIKQVKLAWKLLNERLGLLNKVESTNKIKLSSL